MIDSAAGNQAYTTMSSVSLPVVNNSRDIQSIQPPFSSPVAQRMLFILW
jgi:hypothetical protein